VIAELLDSPGLIDSENEDFLLPTLGTQEAFRLGAISAEFQLPGFDSR
jgi:hypothetical protein